MTKHTINKKVVDYFYELSKADSAKKYLIQRVELFGGRIEKCDEQPFWSSLTFSEDCNMEGQPGYIFTGHSCIGYAGWDEGSELYLRYNNQPFCEAEHGFKILDVRLGLKPVPLED
jgi:hypothetical protein